ncbi:hypothetical protein G7Y79_00009g026590 [Physcia stellaris]|nr:hypothetical protein G7Y79_00009g026590 [Physcia stellaris]
MPTISDFIPASGYKFPSRQILPSQSRSNEPLAVPQIHTAWQFALAKYRPFTLETEESVLAHRNLLRHLISDQSPSTPQQDDPSTPSKPFVTIPELKSPAHAPYVLFLFLNIGLIRAWLGETFRAKRYFETASPMDDGKVPANTAILFYLLGCTQFLLKQWRPSRRSFERCLLSFGKNSGTRPDKGELELGLAAPWVGVSIEHDLEGQGKKERERALEERFKYKVYVPPLSNREKMTPKIENDNESDEPEWQEWSLERTAVEANLTAAKMKLAWKESGRESETDEDVQINGFPGGVLFYPLDLPSSTKTTSPVAKPQNQAQTLEQPKENPPPNTPLSARKAPTWNKETQSFEPYVPPPLPTPQFHPLLFRNHAHHRRNPRHPLPLPTTITRPPSHSRWQNIDSEPSPTLAAQIEEDTRHLHFDPTDLPPPSPEIYTDPESTGGARPPTRETNRQRLERDAESRKGVVLEGRSESREGLDRGRSMSGRFKGLVRRSVASLRRGSREAGGRGEGREGVALSGCAVVDDEDDGGRKGRRAWLGLRLGILGTVRRRMGRMDGLMERVMGLLSRGFGLVGGEYFWGTWKVMLGGWEKEVQNRFYIYFPHFRNSEAGDWDAT